jgi:ApbE superfamily uncharacterized protein (UPF0280 family)
MISRRHFEMGQTAATVLCEEEHYEAAALGMAEARRTIEAHILQDPIFAMTLEPHHVAEDAAPLLKNMAAAARLAGVGPMAAVAGAVSQAGVEAIEAAGGEYCVIDNGGDLCLLLDREQLVGLFCGDERFSHLAFRCPPRGRFSMCTSSGTVGPSISFGVADAAIVVAQDACLADACATRLGNEVTDTREETLRRAVRIIAAIEGVEGCMAIAGGRVAIKGQLPEFAEAPPSLDRVSRSRLQGQKMSGFL